MIFRSRKRQGGSTAVLEREFDPSAVSLAEVYDEIARLAESNRAHPDHEVESAILDLRHKAGARLRTESDGGAQPDPAFDELALSATGVPEISAADLTAEIVRAGMLRHGCIIVRGLISEPEAKRLVGEIDQGFETRERLGRPGGEPFFDEFVPDPPFTLIERGFVADAGGFWTADSPRLMFSVTEIFEQTGLRDVATKYLGERPTLSVNKCVLRKVGPGAGAAWHQDGAFLGDVRALNVWLSLSRCGDVAPGLDLVPKRLEHIVETGTEGAIFDWSVSPAKAEEAAGEAGIVRPIFEPGDAVFFDEMFLHNTAIAPGMTDTRYAIETWFFGAASGYPDDYVPLAL